MQPCSCYFIKATATFSPVKRIGIGATELFTIYSTNWAQITRVSWDRKFMKQRGNNWCYLSADRGYKSSTPLESGRFERIRPNRDRDDEYSRGEGKLDRFNFRVNLRKIEISLSLSLSFSEVREGRCTRLNKEIMNAFDWEWAESKKGKKERKERNIFEPTCIRTWRCARSMQRNIAIVRIVQAGRSRSSDPRLATQGGKSDPLLPRTWMPGVCLYVYICTYVCITCNAHNIHFLQGDHGEHACENSCANSSRAIARVLLHTHE